MNYSIDNINISKIQTLIPPAILCEDYPITPNIQKFVFDTRNEIRDAIRIDNNNDNNDNDNDNNNNNDNDNKQKKRIVIYNMLTSDVMDRIPEMIRMKYEFANHDPNILFLVKLSFENPRVCDSWKGLIHDPNRDHTFKINQGLKIARKMLLELNEHEIPVACEYTNTIIPQYLSDLVSWCMIREESQAFDVSMYRELASGLSMPVGFQCRDNDIEKCIEVMLCAQKPHTFLGLTTEGLCSIVHTKGNEYCHAVVIGGFRDHSYNNDRYSNKVLIDLGLLNIDNDNDNKDNNILKMIDSVLNDNNHIFGIII
jgi:3-deoxy-7-phosphoheptulonate synthase